MRSSRMSVNNTTGSPDRIILIGDYYITPDTEYVFGVIFSCGNFWFRRFSPCKA